MTVDIRRASNAVLLGEAAQRIGVAAKTTLRRDATVVVNDQYCRHRAA
jgi:hypothetical protein